MLEHPNEVPLAFRAPSGSILPTKEGLAIFKAAEAELTPAQRDALCEQVHRQTKELRNA